MKTAFQTKSKRYLINQALVHNQDCFVNLGHHHYLEFFVFYMWQFLWGIKMSKLYHVVPNHWREAKNITANYVTIYIYALILHPKMYFKYIKLKQWQKTAKLSVIESMWKKFFRSQINLTKHFVTTWAVLLFRKRMRIFWKEDNGETLFGCFRLGVAQSRISSFYISAYSLCYHEEKTNKVFGLCAWLR